MKDMKLKCSLCRARHRSRFVLQFPDKTVCQDCAAEYRKIFFNFKNRDARKREPLQIPKEVSDHYDAIFFRPRREKRELDEFMKKLMEDNGISEDS